jgi:hypothetical protein
VTRFNRLLIIGSCVLGGMLFSACADEATGPRPQPELVSISHETPLTPIQLDFTACTPQPSEAMSARIGPQGGILRAGKHMLKIPAGALKRTTLITMAAPSDSLNYVVFGPEGLTFDPANEPTLVMSYRNCPVKDREEPALEIVYTDDAMTTVLDTTQTIAPPDTLNHTVGARLKHFSKYVLHSRYAIAY